MTTSSQSSARIAPANREDPGKSRGTGQTPQIYLVGTEQALGSRCLLIIILFLLLPKKLLKKTVLLLLKHPLAHVSLSTGRILQ